MLVPVGACFCFLLFPAVPEYAIVLICSAARFCFCGDEKKRGAVVNASRGLVEPRHARRDQDLRVEFQPQDGAAILQHLPPGEKSYFDNTRRGGGGGLFFPRQFCCMRFV